MFVCQLYVLKLTVIVCAKLQVIHFDPNQFLFFSLRVSVCSAETGTLRPLHHSLKYTQVQSSRLLQFDVDVFNIFSCIHLLGKNTALNVFSTNVVVPQLLVPPVWKPI